MMFYPRCHKTLTILNMTLIWPKHTCSDLNIVEAAWIFKSWWPQELPWKSHHGRRTRGCASGEGLEGIHLAPPGYVQIWPGCQKSQPSRTRQPGRSAGDPTSEENFPRWSHPGNQHLNHCVMNSSKNVGGSFCLLTHTKKSHSLWNDFSKLIFFERWTQPKHQFSALSMCIYNMPVCLQKNIGRVRKYIWYAKEE